MCVCVMWPLKIKIKELKLATRGRKGNGQHQNAFCIGKWSLLLGFLVIAFGHMATWQVWAGGHYFALVTIVSCNFKIGSEKDHVST